MKKGIIFIAIITIALSARGIQAQTTEATRERLGRDPRHHVAQQVDAAVSTDRFLWKMVMPWTKDLLFYDVAVHFCDSVRLASAGRLDITPFSAGELVPAMQSFDAVSKGIVEAGHDWPGYWKGKNEAFVAFASVPFGLDAEGYNIWLYERGGLALLQELYGQYELHALPAGQMGQEMGFFSNKRATKMEDFAGLRVRTVGWYMDILTKIGVIVSPLPGGEILSALKQNLIDAAEFSAPAMNYSIQMDTVAKYVIQPGVHQPGTQCTVFFNQDAWQRLPEDLQWIVRLAAKETQLWSYGWINNLNADAIREYQQRLEIVSMDTETMIEFRKTTREYLEELKQQYPDVQKVLDSQEAFIEAYESWRTVRSGVTPWSYDTYISGQTSE